MNKTTKKILRTVTGIIVALVIIGGAVWMITGLSPQALIVRAFLKPMTMDKYEEAMNDKTDKSTTEIPAEVKFPREVAEYRVGGMQVFEVPAADDTKPVVLISPWVDVMGGDLSIQEHDNWLTVDVLQKYGADWADGIDVNDPMISPLNGDMNGLPPTDLFTGTWEVFYTDVLKTYEKMKAAGVKVQLHVAEKMGHVYPLHPSPEGRKARKEIADIIRK